MDVIGETTEKGVCERHFEFKAGKDVVAGIMWTPGDGGATGTRRPTILIGHGGTQHKRAQHKFFSGRWAPVCEASARW